MNDEHNKIKVVDWCVEYGKLKEVNNELLEACKGALEDLDFLKEHIPMHRDTRYKLRQAIAKTEGREE